MSWITLTEEHVKNRLSGPELEAWRSRALADGQTDTVPGVLISVTNEVRGYVGANPRNSLGAGDTIPDELLDAAMALVIPRLSTRLPIRLSQERVAAKDDALRLLRDVAENRFRVASAEDLDPVQPGGVEHVSGAGHRPTSASINGLI